MAEPDGEFADLLAKARAGDGDALRLLAERYEPKIRVIAKLLVGAPLRPYLDSGDVVQSVHRSLMAGVRGGKFDLSTPANLVALAVTMLRRKIARQWRRLQKQQRLSQAGTARPDGPAEPMDAHAGREVDPAREAELRDAARRLCSQLGETDQRMLELRMQGYSTDEIAAQLGISPVALRVRLTRLRQRLQESGISGDA